MNLDKTFKNKIQDLKSVPLNAEWDKHENWNLLCEKRKYQNRTQLRRVLAIAASIIVLLSISFCYQLIIKNNIKADLVKRKHLNHFEEFLANNTDCDYLVDYTKQISSQYKIIKELDDVIILYIDY